MLALARLQSALAQLQSALARLQRYVGPYEPPPPTRRGRSEAAPRPSGTAGCGARREAVTSCRATSGGSLSGAWAGGPSAWCSRGTARWWGLANSSPTTPLRFPAYSCTAPRGPGCLGTTRRPFAPFLRACAVAGREGAHTVKIEPEVLEQHEDVKALLGRIGFRKARYDLNQKTTLVVDLSLPEEELLARMRSKTRYNVRRAARKGVEVVEPDFEEAWETFYEWMKATSARKEDYVLRRPRDYLRGVMGAMHEAGQGHLFLAKHEGTPLAGMYVFTFGDKYWYMYGASSDEKRNLKPNYLLQWEVMRWARERGLTHYDMVGVPKAEDLDESSSLWGVYKFKEGFGGEIVDSLGCFDLPVRRGRAAAWYEFEPVYYRLYYKLRNNVFY